MFNTFKKSYFLFLFIITISLITCKKEAEKVFPIVVVSSPYENQIYTVLDTMAIMADVTHNKVLKSISMAIVDMELKPVTSRFNLNPGSNEYRINSNIIIDNIELSSGNYYLHIRASDGENETNSYTKIFIYELPRVLEDIYIITKSNYGTIIISKTDTAFQLIPLLNISSDYGYADTDPINKLLYISGKYNNKLYCIDYQNNIEIWNKIVPGYSPLPYFTDLKVEQKICYIALRQNAIMAYNPSGILVYNHPTNTERYPVKLHFLRPYLISAQKNINNQNFFIVLNYKESGSFHQQLQTGLDICDFYTKDDNNIFVLANDMSDNAEVRIYDIENNGVWEPYNFTNGKITSSAMVDNNTIFIGYEDAILKYTFNPPGAVTYINNIQASCMKYDVTNQKLYIATKDKKLLRYSYPFANLEQQSVVNDSICELLLIYNR